MLNATQIIIIAVHGEEKLEVTILTDHDPIKFYLEPGVAERLRIGIADGLRRLEQFKRTGEMEANRVY